MNFAYQAQTATNAANNAAAGNNAGGVINGLLAFIAKQIRPLDNAVPSFIEAGEMVADTPAAPRGFFARLAESEEARRRRLDDAYLAEATDLYDLEYRSRECDRRNRSRGIW